ncbi:mobile element protein [Gracilibacillus boraciitolerans JCM 21714]|uniref:Mobile element protein n=1 Tax=Gracilibacillus boraciitolerans JCM 21714 TaxID=1298598 RepID=W4VKQ6_9BACI|nr:ATP-binding protein [Gracilibacillus boraciitolerans]GAE93802.1 mobile element protein [Gracilibacillus boraciitolerans JCM 21714]
MSDLIRARCKSLRLAYIADIYEKIPFDNPEQYVAALFQQELELREAAKGERLIKKAKLMNEKELKDYQWSDHIRFPPQLDRNALELLHFIDRKENLILTGAPGTGNYRKF